MPNALKYYYEMGIRKPKKGQIGPEKHGSPSEIVLLLIQGVLQGYNHSLFWMDPGKNPIRCINHSFFWIDLGKNPIRCINHSFFWMDPGKNPIRCTCINHSFFWINPGKIPLGVHV